MTPEQFEQKMRFLQFYFGDNPERLRHKLIECMVDTLDNLGYTEGVKYFRRLEEDK